MDSLSTPEAWPETQKGKRPSVTTSGKGVLELGEKLQFESLDLEDKSLNMCESIFGEGDFVDEKTFELLTGDGWLESPRNEFLTAKSLPSSNYSLFEAQFNSLEGFSSTGQNVDNRIPASNERLLDLRVNRALCLNLMRHILMPSGSLRMNRKQ